MDRFTAASLAILPLMTVACSSSTLGERAAILSAELHRDSASLEAFLRPGAPQELRRQAIVALGRIGDDGRAPEILGGLLETESEHTDEVLWACGVAGTGKLADPLLQALERHLIAENWGGAAGAARALGWTGTDSVADALLPLLAHPSTRVQESALLGLARLRLAERRCLLAASEHASSPDRSIQTASELATWNMARPYAARMRAESEAWDGDGEVVMNFLPLLQAVSVERRLGAVRVLGELLPRQIEAGGPFDAVLELLGDPEARVAQEAVQRIYTGRTGVEAALIEALGHGDAKVRTLAADAVKGSDDGRVLEALRTRLGQESDERVRARIVVALARNGDDAWALEPGEGPQNQGQKPARMLSMVSDALLAAQDPEGLPKLFAMADPSTARQASLPAHVWTSILGGLSGRRHPGLAGWTSGFFDDQALADHEERPFILAAAVGLVASSRLHGLTPRVLDLLNRSTSAANEEIRRAAMTAFADLAGDEDCPPDSFQAMRAAVEHAMSHDPSPWVRFAARTAAAGFGIENIPEFDALAANDWKGVPRAKKPLQGVDSVGGGEWLTEPEILRIADWIEVHDPRLTFETTQGTFSVALSPRQAPVHCVSLFNAVRNGTYTETRWHRVVPSFVIQGGDPHGHGGGGGGWTVPDEINRLPFVRGALGMPKSVKDDGGCQLFIMLSDYHPLNERYTCYGRVVEGMEVVDRIRVDDLILSARVD